MPSPAYDLTLSTLPFATMMASTQPSSALVLTTAANAAAEQLFVNAVGLLLHLTVLGSNAALVHGATVIERRRDNPLSLHAIKLCVARDLDLRLREDVLRFSAGCPCRDTKEREDRQADATWG